MQIAEWSLDRIILAQSCLGLSVAIHKPRPTIWNEMPRLEPFSAWSGCAKAKAEQSPDLPVIESFDEWEARQFASVPDAGVVTQVQSKRKRSSKNAKRRAHHRRKAVQEWYTHYGHTVA